MPFSIPFSPLLLFLFVLTCSVTGSVMKRSMSGTHDPSYLSHKYYSTHAHAMLKKKEATGGDMEKVKALIKHSNKIGSILQKFQGMLNGIMNNMQKMHESKDTKSKAVEQILPKAPVVKEASTLPSEYRAVPSHLRNVQKLNEPRRYGALHSSALAKGSLVENMNNLMNYKRKKAVFKANNDVRTLLNTLSNDNDDRKSELVFPKKGTQPFKPYPSTRAGVYPQRPNQNEMVENVKVAQPMTRPVNSRIMYYHQLRQNQPPPYPATLQAPPALAPNVKSNGRQISSADYVKLQKLYPGYNLDNILQNNGMSIAPHPNRLVDKNPLSTQFIQSGDVIDNVKIESPIESVQPIKSLNNINPNFEKYARIPNQQIAEYDSLKSSASVPNQKAPLLIEVNGVKYKVLTPNSLVMLPPQNVKNIPSFNEEETEGANPTSSFSVDNLESTNVNNGEANLKQLSNDMDSLSTLPMENLALPNDLDQSLEGRESTGEEIEFPLTLRLLDALRKQVVTSNKGTR